MNTMNITILEQNSFTSQCISPRICTFLFHNIPLCIINTLRRIIMNDLIHVGFNEKNIEIIKNTTTWNNEILAHRISLIPILSLKNIIIDQKYNNEIFKDNTVSKGHNNEMFKGNTAIKEHNNEEQINNEMFKDKTYTFEINEINTNDNIMYITSNNLKIVQNNTGHNTNNKVNAKLFDDILICQLKKHDELQIVAKADFNCAKNAGIAYKPVINVYFKPIQLIYVQSKNKKNYLALLKYFRQCSFNLYPLYCNKQQNNTIPKIENNDVIPHYSQHSKYHRIKSTYRNTPFSKYNHIIKNIQQRLNYICLGFSDNITNFDYNELCTKTLKIEPDSYIIEPATKQNLNVYSFIIELFFKENNACSILLSALHKFSEKLQIFLESRHKYTVICNNDDPNPTNNIYNKENTTNNTNQIILHINNTNINENNTIGNKNICETILNPIAYFLRQNDNILFAHYNKTHPDQTQIDLYITLKHTNEFTNKQLILTQFTMIMKQTIINMQKNINELCTILENK